MITLCVLSMPDAGVTMVFEDCVTKRNMLALKDTLKAIIYPDVGLLNYLCIKKVLSKDQCDDISMGQTLQERNSKLLYYLLDCSIGDHKYDEIMEAFEQSGQRHIWNYIRYGGGKRRKYSLKCELLNWYEMVSQTRK